MLDPTPPTKALLSVNVYQVVVSGAYTTRDFLFSHDADVTLTKVIFSFLLCYFPECFLFVIYASWYLKNHLQQESNYYSHVKESLLLGNELQLLIVACKFLQNFFLDPSFTTFFHYFILFLSSSQEKPRCSLPNLCAYILILSRIASSHYLSCCLPLFI